MSPDGGVSGEPRGPIAYMASNPVAANFLMAGILVAGLVSLTGLEREAWPTFRYHMIEVTVPYPGANPQEVEESVVIKIEEHVSSLDGVKSVRSVSAPGIASVQIEAKSSADIKELMDDVESAVGRIRSFPEGAERARFAEMSNYQSVIRIVVFGDVGERSLKEIARQVEDDLASLPSISRVETTGTGQYEVSVEVPTHQLRALGLTLDDIAAAIRVESLELSAGSIESRDSEIRVRTVGQRYNQYEFEDVGILTLEDGTVVRLGDVAVVRDDFQENRILVRHMGRPAAFVEVFRADDESISEVASAVHDHISGITRPSLPPGVEVSILNDESQTYSERVELLIRNGVLGLLLVMISLALFMEIRLALWVVMGLMTSGIGALAAMLVFEVSINTISLFVFVLAIGIIVDDAIVVSENIYDERQRGTSAVQAAIRGARRIKKPLTFAVLTSMAAFTPVFFIPGGIGEIWRALPIVVISMLFISLVESLFVLPSHLSYLHGPDWSPANRIDLFFWRCQTFANTLLRRFVEGPLDTVLRVATKHPALIAASTVGVLAVSVCLVPAGLVKTTFADVIEGDFVNAHLEMPEGTSSQRTLEVAEELEQAGRRVLDRLSEQLPDGAPHLLSEVLVLVGGAPRLEGGGVVPHASLNPEPHVAAVEFKLISAQRRDISTVAVAQAWREEVGFLPHVRGVDFSGEVIDLGSPVEAILSHPDPDRLVEIADGVVDGLRDIEGVFDVRSDHAPGVREMQLELKPAGRVAGLTLDQLARQARAAFFGAEALRIQRGREEVKVLVRLPEEERNSITDIERYLVRTPQGAELPLMQVASMTPGRAPTLIRRRDNQRVVTVTAEVDRAVISASEANHTLANSILAEFAEDDPGFGYVYGGEQQQQQESLGAMQRGFVMVLFAMYAMLAISLRSYTKPLIVMAIIPFGMVGVVLGHAMLGAYLGATSILGFFGLAGVVVNDSLVMIDFIDERLREGAHPREAIIEGAKSRFRPIALTSVTTFLGFTPMILEPSIQAQFLKPFAASLGIGIVITTAILVVLVPALMAVYLRINSRGRVAAAFA